MIAFKKGLAMTMMAGMVATVAAGCGSSSTTTASKAASKAPVLIDVFSPFSGPNAFIGAKFNLPPVQAAAYTINQAGGILGRPLKILHTDSGADVADALPAAQRLLVKEPHLNGLIGITSGEVLALQKVFSAKHIVMMTASGTSQLNSMKLKYLWRPVAPDNVASAAMAMAALKEGYKRAAIMMGANGAAQSTVPGLIKAYQKHGGKIVVNESLTLDQPSYRTEVARMLKAKPQVIFTETDPQTAATLFANIKQLGGLKLPVLGTDAVNIRTYKDAVAKAVGGMAVESKFMQMVPYAASTTPGLPTLDAAYKKLFPKLSKPGSISAAMYDAAVIMALAMDEAHSTNPAVYDSYITKVTNNSKGVPVNNYAQGLKEIKAGKAIQYIGATGKKIFNQYHWVSEGFNVVQVTPSGSNKIKFHLSAAQVAKYAH